MDTNSQALHDRTRNPRQASTRHHVVEERFAGILAEDFDIPCDVILEALGGEPQKQAIKITSWAERTDDPAYALICWARRHGRGGYRVPREAHGRPSRDRYGHRRGVGAGRYEDGRSLRRVVVDADVLDRIAQHLGVA